jgi:hypothetical protein
MTVNDLLRELRKLQRAGMGDARVFQACRTVDSAETIYCPHVASVERYSSHVVIVPDSIVHTD